MLNLVMLAGYDHMCDKAFGYILIQGQKIIVAKFNLLINWPRMRTPQDRYKLPNVFIVPLKKPHV